MTPNPSTHGSPLRSFLIWGAVAIIGAWALGVIALQRGEPINAVWLIVAAICVYLIGYRFYSKFIAEKVLELAKMLLEGGGNDDEEERTYPYPALHRLTAAPFAAPGKKILP